MAKPEIYTIGYEKATQADFITALKKAGVEQVIDVRARPISRKPGFSKNNLAASLVEAGIAYVGLPALGTPPDGRDAARDHRLNDLKRIYGTQLETPEAELAAQQLRDLVAEKPSALLCYEREPEFCHRTLLRKKILADYAVTDIYP